MFSFFQSSKTFLSRQFATTAKKVVKKTKADKAPVHATKVIREDLLEKKIAKSYQEGYRQGILEGRKQEILKTHANTPVYIIKKFTSKAIANGELTKSNIAAWTSKEYHDWYNKVGAKQVLDLDMHVKAIRAKALARSYVKNGGKVSFDLSNVNDVDIAKWHDSHASSVESFLKKHKKKSSSTSSASA